MQSRRRATVRRTAYVASYPGGVRRRPRILPVRPGEEHAVATALARALDGSGPPLAPVAADTPARDLGAVDDDVALVVTTSGSTGEPRAVALTAGALRASADATAERLGGPGQWLLALPVQHVAGLQVLTRSVLAGTAPVVLDLAAPFTPEAFAAATERLDGARRLTSLVPTQLHRLLAVPHGRAALASFDAVLVGGAATDPRLVREARAAGARLVLTYGMTETAGGCVYDGVPLDGVRVRLDDDARIHLAGPVLASGYVGEPGLTARTFAVDDDGVRWLRTNDLGRLAGGVLDVLGRADDVITTGGVKVAPAAVEAAITELPEVAHACVVGVPDPEWGAVVVGVLVLTPGAEAPSLEEVRARVTPTLGARSAPRRLVVVEELPARGPGKVDRRAVARIAAQAQDERAPGRPRTGGA